MARLRAGAPGDLAGFAVAVTDLAPDTDALIFSRSASVAASRLSRLSRRDSASAGFRQHTSRSSG